MFKISIRPLAIEDAQTSFQWRNDAEVWRFTGSRPDTIITLKKEKEWIENVLQDGSCRRFAILCDYKYIGNIQLTDITAADAQYHIFIGDKNYWGKGIAQLATYQILHFAKEELKLKNVYLSVKEENISAIKTYLKSSFQEVARNKGYLKMDIKLSNLLAPTVSVFVMVYNHESYLKTCLDGMLMQKCTFNFNIIVGEDCSTDQSRKTLQEYQDKHPGKFKLLLHDKNIGAVNNQISVFENCNGKYIAMCEGDDYWTDPLKLQKQVDFLEANPEYVLTFHPIKILNTDGTFVEDFITKVPANYELQETLAKGNNYIHTPSVVYRNVIKSFPPEFVLSPVGDYFMYILLTDHGKVKMLPDTMAVYRYAVGVHSTLSQKKVSDNWKKTIVLLISATPNIKIKKILLDSMFPQVIETETSKKLIVKKTGKKKVIDWIKLFIPPIIIEMKNHSIWKKN